MSTCRRRWSPSAGRASRATIPISWPPISSIIFWAAAASRHGSTGKCAKSAGLAYGVSDSLVWFRRAAVVLGGTATRADRTADALAVIEQEIKRMADGRSDARRTCGRQIIPQGLLCAVARHLRQDRGAAHPDPDRQSRHRLYSAPRRPDRCGDHRGRQARGAPPVRRRHAGDGRRPAKGADLERIHGIAAALVSAVAPSARF